MVVLTLAALSSGSLGPGTVVAAALCGAALILLAAGRVGIPAGLAFLAATWALVLLAVLVSGLDGGPGSLHPAAPARASLIVPSALALAGLGLLHYPLLALATALCGMCVLVIGAAHVLLPSMDGVARLAGISPHNVAPRAVALMLLCLGGGLMATAPLRPSPARRLGYRWAPLGATSLLVMGSVVLWQALVHLQQRDLARLTRSAATTMSESLLREVEAIGSVLRVLASREPRPHRAWADEADVLRRTSPGLLALAFTDVALERWQWIWLTPSRVPPPKLTVEDRALLRASWRDRRLVFTHVGRRADGTPVARIALPRIRPGTGSGFVVATLDVGTLIEARVAAALQDYAVRIDAGDRPVFESPAEGLSWTGRRVHRRVMTLPGGTQWTLLLNPSRALRASTSSTLPEIVLGGGLLLAVLLGSTLRLARTMAWQATNLAREVEQRERAEAELRTMATELERRVHERTEELSRANDNLGQENAMRRRAEANLRRSNDDLRQFAAFVSHELRQPLSTIGIWAELLESGEPPLTDKQRRHLGKIRASVTRMTRLIESELALAQLSRGELPKEPVDLARLVDEIRADMTAVLGPTGGRLEVGPLSVVTADPQQLRLLFRNLLENAIKYHGAEPPVVHIEERDPGDPSTCTIVVRDNGRGFPPDTGDQMFEIFDRSADKTIPGAGIGLAICRRIVERHGGRITASGRDGAGATFVIELPRAGAEPDTTGSPPREPPAATSARGS